MSAFRAQDAWRKHPLVTRGIESAFPGFRRAVIIFSVYLALDLTYSLAKQPRRGLPRNYRVAEWEKPGIGENPRHKTAESHHNLH